MERFGMFFIDDLDPDDMERINMNLGQKDGSEIRREHKRTLTTMLSPKEKKTKDKGIQLTASRISTEYPWGETISWSMLQRLCKLHPVDFFRQFNFETMDGWKISSEILEITQDLFISFTKDTWLCFQESFLPAGIRPKPSNLKEAMEIWACQTILGLLGGKSIFLPSTYQLEGAPKKKKADVSFRELRSLFFPCPNKDFRPNTIWEGYMEQSGYIGRYWEVLKEKEDEPDIIDGIHNYLDDIFGQLQCLPQSTADSIWHATDGSVCFLTNPIYYRVKSINSAGRQTVIGPQRPQVSTAELWKRLHPGMKISRKRKKGNSTKAKTKTRARLNKAKNYRQPPQARKKQKVAFLRSSKGNDEEDCDDDNSLSHSSFSTKQLDINKMNTDSDSFISDSVMQ